MEEKLTNLVLTLVSCLIGLVICEVAYRGYLVWEEDARYGNRPQFWVYSNSIYDFNAALGYEYRPQGQMDVAFLKNGVPVRCRTVVTGALGSPGKGIDPTKLGAIKFVVLGDSFSAWVEQAESWPDILSRLIEERSGVSAPILNLARDGYGVLQMFDQAAQSVREGRRPEAFIVAITGADLVRARFWRMTRERNGATEVFTSFEPSRDVRPETHIRTLFVDGRVTREWCEALRAAGRTDETAKKIALAFDETRRADESFFRYDIDMFSLTHCYVCDRIVSGRPVRDIARAAGNPAHGLTRFQDDPRFQENVAVVRASGTPIWLVYLPVVDEMRSARQELSTRELSLLESLKSAVDRYIDLTPEVPMGKAAVALSLLPEDVHPSHAGLEYYAEEMARRISTAPKNAN